MALVGGHKAGAGTLPCCAFYSSLALGERFSLVT